MRIVVSLLLLLSYNLLAQTTVYQPSEVDSIAEPHGGVALLDTFLQSTLRKPIQAEAEGIDGKVVVSGIVEVDGRISDVKVVQSFRPDCDREAIRTFSLFNAWKPAQKNGQSVRQHVIFPVTFLPGTPFTYVNGTRVDYLDAKGEIISDSSQARYKRIIPIDTTGVPTADAIVYEYKKRSWSEYVRFPFVREKSVIDNLTNKSLYAVGNKNYTLQWEGKMAIVDENNRIVRLAFYKAGKRNRSEFSYYPNGSIAEKKEYLSNNSITTTWYSNGQVKERESVNYPTPSVFNPLASVSAFWDSTGYQKVKDGNGYAVYREQTKSRSDTAKQTYFVEQGLYQNGFKQEIWMGRYTDGSYFYEERYDKGICIEGKAWKVGADTMRYTVPEQQPEFTGGYPALGQFLAKNMHYPVEAQKAKISGRVYTSFIIDKNGDVNDVHVVKGLGYGCDEESVRVIKATNGYWKPGVYRGEKVRVKYTLPLNFTLL